MKAVKNRLSVSSVGYPLAIAAMISLAVSPTATALAADSSQASSTSSQTSITSNQTSNAPNATEKKETVYVFSNSNGTVKNTKVYDTLKNDSGTDQIADSSSLTNIENVEDNNGYSGTGANMVWDADGQTIYYKGDSSAKEPVSVKVTYKLDGKEMQPADMEGKSGQVSITYEYTNNSYTFEDVNGENRRVYTPFMCVTGMALDNDTFSNVEIDNGKIVDDGDRSMVVGYALPGMQENLDLSDNVDLDIPSSFTITADATDFSIGASLSFVTSDMFKDLDANDFDTQDLASSLNELQDAMNQLIEGGGELSDGLDELSDGLGELSAGTTTLKTSVSSLPDGVNQLYDASGQVYRGLNLLKNGDDKSTGLIDALSSIGAGTSDQKTLYGGTMAIKAGVDQLKGTSTDTSGSLYAAKNGADAIQTGAQQLSAGSEQLIAGIGTSSDTGTQTINGALNTAQAALGTTNAGDVKAALESLQSAKTTLEQCSGYATEAGNTLQEMSTTLGQVDLSSAITKLGDAQNNIDTSGYQNIVVAQQTLNSIDETGMTQDQINELESAKASLNSIDVTKLGTASAEVAGVKSALEQANASITALSASLTQEAQEFITAGTNLKNAANQLSSINPDAVNDAVNYATVQQILSGVQSSLNNQVVPGLQQAKGGADQIATGAGSISEGMGTAIYAIDNQLDPGLQQIVDGLATMQNGGTAPDGRTSAGLSGAVNALGSETTNGTLIYGAYAINGGLATLSNSTPALMSGIDQLEAGAQAADAGGKSAAAGGHELYDGLIQFNDEGISQITALGDDADAYKARLTAMVDAGKAYNNFSGISDGTDGSVRFIYKVDGIGED